MVKNVFFKLYLGEFFIYLLTNGKITTLIIQLMKLSRLFLLTMMAAITACQEYVPVATYVEPDDPVTPTEEQVAEWNTVSGFNAAWGDADYRYSRSLVPQIAADQNLRLTLWKGEKGSAQAILWSNEAVDGVECKFKPFRGDAGSMPADIAQARFVRYGLSDDVLKSGRPAILSADMLDNLDRFDIKAQTVRPVWVTFDIPEDVESGIYESELIISHNGWGKKRLPIELEIVNHTLPAASEWEFHLDLWQHPTALARAEGLELWSDEHFEALKRTMKLVADAGQKVITATLNKDPWNHQCYDGYANMINWTLKKDGTWSFEYKIFDRWVEMMLDLGINKMINCYSMAPWNCELEYFDEAQDKMITVVAEPGTKIFEEIWEPFLIDFSAHLKEKGWLDITNIAMDERPAEMMDAAVKVLEKCAPEMGFALADNHQTYKKFSMMRDVCVFMCHKVDPADLKERREKGYSTTFYVCCGPAYPNTFTSSQPYESELLGWHGVAWDFDGMLRWAYNSWCENPVMDSRYGAWPAGDTFLVYPEARSSVRFERLIDGIEVSEKVRILKEEGVDLQPLYDALNEEFLANNINDPAQPWCERMNKVKVIFEEISRK